MLEGIVYAPVPCPPADHRRFLKVATIEGLPCRYDFLCYSREVIGLNVHYMDRRSVACPGPKHASICPGCQAKVGVRWSGYLVGLLDKDKLPRLLHVTPGANRNCPGLNLNAGKLRGRWLTVSRLYRGRNAPLRIFLNEAQYNPDWPELPDSVDAIGRLLGIEMVKGVQS